MFPIKWMLFYSCSLFSLTDINWNRDIKGPAADIKQISENKDNHIYGTVTNTLSLAN